MVCLLILAFIANKYQLSVSALLQSINITRDRYVKKNYEKIASYLKVIITLFTYSGILYSLAINEVLNKPVEMLQPFYFTNLPR